MSDNQLKWMTLTLPLLALLVSPIHTTNACTRILVADKGNAVVVGRNMDWAEDTQTNFIVYPRHLQHSGAPTGINAKQGNWIHWTSNYANIVATGYDNLTTDGFNEKGLAAHMLWFERSDYGKIDESKPGLSLTVWAQYYLDNFASVADAVSYTKDHPFQIVPFFHEGTQQWGKLHLILDDASGDSAIFEYINGELQIFHDSANIAATNDPSYDMQMENLKDYLGFGGSKPLPGKTSSRDRFVRATFLAKILPQIPNPRELVSAVLGILNNTAHPYNTTYYRTYWHSLADLTNKIYYYQSVDHQNLISVRLDAFNFNSPDIMMLDLVHHPDYVGDMTDRFTKVSEEEITKPSTHFPDQKR